jgi:hypothetical protein
LERGDPRLARIPAVAVGSDINIQEGHRAFGGYVGRNKQSFLPASHPLIEPVKKPMEA